jgi:hypothetical protein
MHPVISTTLTAAGYEHESCQLFLDFTSGARYRYAGVPAYIQTGPTLSASKGLYFNDCIKDKFSSALLRRPAIIVIR